MAEEGLKGGTAERRKMGPDGVHTPQCSLRNTVLEFLPPGPEAEDEEDKGTNKKR